MRVSVKMNQTYPGSAVWGQSCDATRPNLGCAFHLAGTGYAVVMPPIILPSEDESSGSGPRSRILWWGLLSAFLLWGLANLQWGRSASWDEFEFLKATDWIRRGEVPYRDFFEHHTPLTWYLMAPLESVSHGPGVAAVLLLRWAQVPLWALACWRIWIWMKTDGDPVWVRLMGLATLLGTPFFVFPALEYRVDTLGTVLVVLGLDFLRQSGWRWTLAAGATLALAVVANLRFGPFVVAVALAACFLDFDSRRWCFQARKMGNLIAGAGLALLPWLLYLLGTHSLSDMWRWCVLENAAATAVTASEGAMRYYLLFPFRHLDIPGMLLELGLVGGGVLTLFRLRRPTFFHLLLFAQAVNLGFLTLMKAQYIYHFELTFCLAVPFWAALVSMLARKAPQPSQIAYGVSALLGLALAINGFNLVARNDYASLRFQDRTLKFAASHLGPEEKVLDGCGWIPSAEPAYKYWFLPLLVRNLSLSNALEPYSIKAFSQDPPALVIANIRLSNWAAEWPEMGRILITHYLPTLPNVWVPGLSYPFNLNRRDWSWTVPESGDYRLLCRPDLMGHPWFAAPFMIISQTTQMDESYTIAPATFQSQGGDELQWTLNGRPTSPIAGSLHLNRGDRLSAHFTGDGPMGVMLVPKTEHSLFQAAPLGANLDNIHIDDYYRPL